MHDIIASLKSEASVRLYAALLIHKKISSIAEIMRLSGIKTHRSVYNARDELLSLKLIHWTTEHRQATVELPTAIETITTDSPDNSTATTKKNTISFLKDTFSDLFPDASITDETIKSFLRVQPDTEIIVEMMHEASQRKNVKSPAAYVKAALQKNKQEQQPVNTPDKVETKENYIDYKTKRALQLGSSGEVKLKVYNLLT